MIITRTPYRISLFGGGTDYVDYYRNNGGAVLGFAINKYCWVTLRKLPPFFEHRHRIVWSRIELANSFNDITHPIVKSVLASEGIHCGVEIHHDGDLPARSGLGSSSSFAVGLLNAIRAFRGHRISAEDLAREAIHIERDLVGDNVGAQDQMWAAYGGFNFMEFCKDDRFFVNPVTISRESVNELNKWFLLVFTGLSRSASEMAGKQIANMANAQSSLDRMKEMVFEAMDILHSGTPEQLGALLHDSWKLKRGLAKGVSTDKVDDIYEVAIGAGAIGGKLLGAGGGGFLLFMAPPERHNKIRERLKNFVHVPFTIGAEGSRVVFYENGDH
jgi:D-glycero-alpha-D-manno-heptose-7-phosphate kinase